MKFYDFHSIKDQSALIDRALYFKQNNFRSDLGKGKTIALVFLNPSLRTRLSTQEAANRMGMQVICFNSGQAWPWEIRDHAVMNGRFSEHIKDAAKVISSYVDIIGIRCFAGLEDYEEDQKDIVIKQFTRYATVPVINMESAAMHPLQSLTDMITLKELFGEKKMNITLSWAPHPKPLPQAVANSFTQWALGMGHNLTITHPRGYELDPSITKGAEICYDQEEAFGGASVVYAKSWCKTTQYGLTNPSFKEWMIDQHKMDLTSNGIFMHCLPIRRNVIASDEVLDGTASVIYRQAKNRLYAAQAVIEHLLKAM